METLLNYGLVAVLAALLLAPLGLPIPEDISLLVAGVLARTGHTTYAHALIVGYIGVVVGDCIAWGIGRRVGLHPTGWLSRFAGEEQIARIERFYRRWGSWTIVICRQVPGMRFPAFFFAGATGVSLPRFLAFDGSAALITVNLYVWLGHTFTDDLQRVVAWVDRFRIVAGLAVLVLVGLLVWRALRRRRAEG